MTQFAWKLVVAPLALAAVHAMRAESTVVGMYVLSVSDAVEPPEVAVIVQRPTRFVVVHADAPYVLPPAQACIALLVVNPAPKSMHDTTLPPVDVVQLPTEPLLQPKQAARTANPKSANIVLIRSPSTCVILHFDRAMSLVNRFST